jgi:uncharacterized membrane protein
MDFYTIFKFLHVLAAMAWFGGGAVMLLQAILAMRQGDDESLMRVTGSLGSLAMLWFLPASGLTLLFGLVVVLLGSLWGEAWVILGLVGALASFVGGHFFLRPMGEEAARLIADGKIAEAAEFGSRMIRIAMVDYASIIAIVALMVLKPNWTDILALVLIYGALGIAAFLILGGKARLHPLRAE